MKIAFQMDPIEDVDINADSTFRLAEEAQNRGHDLYVYTPNDLTFNRGKIIAKGRSISLKRKIGDHVNFGAVELLALSEFDVIWLRQDPPFDMGYITNNDNQKSDTKYPCFYYRCIIRDWSGTGRKYAGERLSGIWHGQTRSRPQNACGQI